MIEKPRYRVKAGSRPHLVVVPLRRRQNPLAVQVARELLEYVESGEISDFAAGIVWQDGGVGSCIATDYYKRSLIGGLDIAKHRILDRVKAEDQ